MEQNQNYIYASNILNNIQDELISKYDLCLKDTGLIDTNYVNEHSDIRINESLLRAYDFLCQNNLITLRKTINKNDSSYGLKHVIEKCIGDYISNGECILLMKMYNNDIKIHPIKYVHNDYDGRLCNYSKNCYFNVKLNKKL